jgi:hypothetical protein
VSVDPSRSVKVMVMATTFPDDCSQSRTKSDCYVGYDAAMKGVSVVVTYFHKSPSVGENGESLPKRPSWLKNDVSSAFLKKRVL